MTRRFTTEEHRAYLIKTIARKHHLIATASERGVSAKQTAKHRNDLRHLQRAYDALPPLGLHHECPICAHTC